MNVQHLTRFRRLEHAVRHAALALGYDGDPLGDPPPHGTLRQEMVAVNEVYAALPADLRNIDRDLAHQMARAAVIGSTRHDDAPPAPSVIYAAAGDPGLHPAIARARAGSAA